MREIAAIPLVAGVLCSIFLFPTRLLGQEIAQVFRRSVDHVISRNDTLFELMIRSETAADTARLVQAWGSWILYGLVAALVAMWLTRWLAARALPWTSIWLVAGIWLAIYLFVWKWDNDIIFNLSALQPAGSGPVWGPWPYAGSFGFFIGLITGLALAAKPWLLYEEEERNKPQG